MAESDPSLEVQAQFLAQIDLLRGFIRALVRDQHAADDILQETFLTVSRKADSFERGTNFIRWACSIARFKVMESRRKGRGDVVPLSPEAIEALTASEDVHPADLRIEAIDPCVDQLPPMMKRAVTLRYQGDHKPAEIARIVGWSAEAVYVSLSRARGLLRDCIEKRMIETPETP